MPSDQGELQAQGLRFARKMRGFHGWSPFRGPFFLPHGRVVGPILVIKQTALVRRRSPLYMAGRLIENFSMRRPRRTGMSFQ